MVVGIATSFFNSQEGFGVAFWKDVEFAKHRLLTKADVCAPPVEFSFAREVQPIKNRCGTLSLAVPCRLMGIRKVPAAIPTPEIMTAQEVQALLRCDRNTLYNYTHIYKGNPPLLTHMRIRGRLLFDRRQVLYFLQKHQIIGTYHLRDLDAWIEKRKEQGR
jgi:hypothetical protein